MVKGNKDLIEMLANADLVTLHDHVLRLAVETDTKIIKVLARLREQEKRWPESMKRRSMFRFGSALLRSKPSRRKATRCSM